MVMKRLFVILREAYHHFVVVGGAVGLTFGVFMILPLIQTLGHPPKPDELVRTVDTISEPPPPPPPVEEEKKEDPPEKQEPPKLEEEAQPLDLSQLEVALNPGGGGGWMGGDFAVNLGNVDATGKEAEALFSIAELDQKPSVIYQPGPRITDEVRKKAPGTAYIIFIVDQDGRVTKPIVQKSTDPVFEKPALDAVSKWKFQPGKRNGKPVRFRMRVPISFPKGL